MRFFIQNRLWFLAGVLAWAAGFTFLAVFGPQSWGPLSPIGRFLLWVVVPPLIGAGLLVVLGNAGVFIWMVVGLIWKTVNENRKGMPKKENNFLLIYLAGGGVLWWLGDKLKLSGDVGVFVGFAYFGFFAWLRSR